MIPLISFIIIEFNCIDEILDCISNIRCKCAGLNYEVIISSNSDYSFATKEQLRAEKSEVTWIFNKQNLGFAKGMNRGISQANGNIFIIMNPDVRLVNSVLVDAYEYLLIHKNVGMLGPKFMDKNGETQDYCRPFITPKNLISRTIKRMILKKDSLLLPHFDYDSVQEVDWIIGAFMIIKREAIEKTGAFDEKYFMYVEDTDLCRRLWESGYKVVYYPKMIVFFKGDMKSTSFLWKRNFLNKYTFCHLISYSRYFFKYGCGVKRKCCHSKNLYDKADLIKQNLLLNNSQLSVLLKNGVVMPQAYRVQKYFEKSNSVRSNWIGKFIFKLREDERVNVIKRWIHDREECEILDAGCGDGSLLKKVLSGSVRRLRLEDNAPSQLYKAQKQLQDQAEYVETSINDFRESCDHSRYDIVLAIGVFDYFPHWPIVLKGLLKRTKGMLIVDFPKSNSIYVFFRWLWLSLNQIELYSVSRRDLCRMFDKCGIEAKITELSYNWIAKIQMT